MNQFKDIINRRVNFNQGDYFNYNTETLQNYNFLDLQEIVAKRASNQLWGNGYVFKSNDEEIQAQIDIIENNINLLELFYKSEKIHSVYGVVIFYLAVFSTERPVIEICMPLAQSKVSRINGNEVACEVYFRYILDDSSRFLKVSADINNIHYSEYDKNKQTVSTLALITKLPKEWNITSADEKNPYNFVPVIFSQNLPKTTFWGDSNLNAIYPDEVGVRGLKELGYKIFQTAWHELEFNKTRAFVNLTQIQYEQLLKSIKKDKMSIRNFIISLGNDANNNSPFNLLVANPQFEKYITFLNWVVRSYFKGCGYSSDEDGSRTQTSMEINTIQSDDVETTRIKRNFRQKTYSRLFSKLLTMMLKGKRDIKPSDFIFLIKENNILDKDKEIARIRELLAMNLTTRIQAIREYYGLTEEQAEKLSNEIAQQNEKDNENLNSIYGEEENGEEEEKEEETETIKTTETEKE